MSDAYYTGTAILVKLDTKHDMSSATNPEIHWKKPDGTAGEWPATINGDFLEYNTTTSDIDVKGTWAFQAVATVAGNIVKGKIVKQNIHQPLKSD